MMVSLTRLIIGTLAFAGMLAVVGYLLRGQEGALLVVPAGLLCLLPACLTLGLCLWVAQGSPEKQLAAFLGGTMLRLVLVLGGGLFLYFLGGVLRQPLLWVWIILFYLFTLALETALILTQVRPQDMEPLRGR